MPGAIPAVAAAAATATAAAPVLTSGGIPPAPLLPQHAVAGLEGISDTGGASESVISASAAGDSGEALVIDPHIGVTDPHNGGGSAAVALSQPLATRVNQQDRRALIKQEKRLRWLQRQQGGQAADLESIKSVSEAAAEDGGGSVLTPFPAGSVGDGEFDFRPFFLSRARADLYDRIAARCEEMVSGMFYGLKVA